MIPHILFWRVQSDPQCEIVFNLQREVIATAIVYLVNPQQQKPGVNSALFYT